MGATFSIITKRVGEGGQTSGIEVRRIQQLLRLAGSDPGPINGQWNASTKKALMDFQADFNWGPVTPYIDQDDPYMRLFLLADCAGVLLDLPDKLRSKSAALTLFDTCRKANITYGWKENGVDIGGGTRTIWGFEGNSGYAVAAKGAHIADAEFDLDVPLSLNCTSFTNLMLSVWFQGNAHSAPYERSQGSGGFTPLCTRYNLQPAQGFYLLNPPGVYKDISTIKSIVDPNRIYYFGICNDSGFIHHDTVVFDWMVYECNLDRTPAVYATPVDEHPLLKHSHFTVYGPGPH